MLFNLDFAENTFLSYLFFFFLIIDLLFLIPAAIAQIFNSIAELVILIGIPIKEAKAVIEIDPVNVEAKIRKCSYYLELCKPLCAFYSSIHFTIFLQGNNFFHLYFSI